MGNLGKEFLAIVGIFSLLGVLSFAVWTSNQMETIRQNPENATNIAGEVITKGVEEIAGPKTIKTEIIILVIAILFSALSPLILKILKN